MMEFKLYSIINCFNALYTASVQFFAFDLYIIEEICALTVCVLINNFFAILLFVYPLQTNLNTSISLSVKVIIMTYSYI